MEVQPYPIRDGAYPILTVPLKEMLRCILMEDIKRCKSGDGTSQKVAKCEMVSHEMVVDGNPRSKERCFGWHKGVNFVDFGKQIYMKY